MHLFTSHFPRTIQRNIQISTKILSTFLFREKKRLPIIQDLYMNLIFPLLKRKKRLLQRNNPQNLHTLRIISFNQMRIPQKQVQNLLLTPKLFHNNPLLQNPIHRNQMIIQEKNILIILAIIIIFSTVVFHFEII